MNPELVSPLAGLRVLELPGIRTALTGKFLADLGADVVKLEPPGGDELRRRAPFASLDTGERVSLTWLSYSLGKRAFTLDIESEAGRRRLLELAAAADIILHGMTAAAAEAVGLSAEALRAANPGLIVAAVTPFGADGPMSGWQAESLQAFAAGGYLYLTGPEDGTPIQPSAPLQMELHAGGHALAAILLAVRRRRLSGAGSLIDVSMRDAALWMLTNTYQHWDMLRLNIRRLGQKRDMGARRRLRMVYRTADGFAVWMFTTGHLGARPLRKLVEWMDESGMAPAWLKAIDWESTDLLDHGDLPDRLERQFSDFYVTKSGDELLAWAVANGMMLAPIRAVADVAHDRQLATRLAWRTITQPGLGRIEVPGPPVHAHGIRWEPRGPAPLVPAPSLDALEWQPVSPLPLGGGDASRLPLDGVRVLDFGSTLAGPTVARHLADFGADVIKIESETHPDTLRAGTPYAPGTSLDRSGYFGAYNAGKRSFALDLQRPGASDVVRRLVEHADILIENYAPGVMDRLGLTEAQLRAWNPRLIFASHSLQGQTGPLAPHRGYGQIASGMTGWYDLTGFENGEPLGPYSAYTDFLSWPHFLAAILVALEQGDTRGTVARIDHAQIESSIHFIAPLLLDHELNHAFPTRSGNHNADFAPSNAYRCSGDDRWIAITARSDDEWKHVARVLGLDSAANGFAHLAGRKAHERALDALVTSQTQSRDAIDLAAELQSAGVPAAAVARAQDLFDDPQLAHRSIFRRLPHAVLGDHAVLGANFKVEGLSPGPFRAAPLLGEHTFEIASELLALDDEAISALVEAGVLR